MSLIKPGNFLVGSNYLASHAGTAMWSDWRPEVIEKDLKKLAGAGLEIIRVFPLWPDFQPLTLLYTFEGNPAEFRHGEESLLNDEAGQAGVSSVAISRFEEFTRISEKYKLKLIVGLITGWMSGRLFIPPALEGRDIFKDPVALMWQVRFVQYFVKHFIDCSAIVAWELGNECNCLGGVANRETAWHWTSSIVNAIKAVDPHRPIVSGMHSLSPKGNWTIQDQAELTDILTTHPYPLFTPYCDQDPINTMRIILHATAESRFYSDIGHQPCLVEEIGTLGPMISSESIAADFIRANLFSLWAHDCGGLLWWGANDQTHLSHAPYDWYAIECELGLLRVDGTPKPVLDEMGQFAKFIVGLPFSSLPSRITEGVCILSDSQDQWGVAYSTFILSKQAGFDIEFQYETQPIKKASFYMLPCIKGHRVINRQRWLELRKRIFEGATLYISYDDGFLSQFEEVTGLRVETRQRRCEPTKVLLERLEGKPTYVLGGSFKLTLQPIRAKVIGTETDGNPAFTCTSYGKGKVYFLPFPLEMELTTRPGIFHTVDAEPYWQIYRYMAGEVTSGRAVSKKAPQVGVTEHPINEKNRIIIMVNYSPVFMEVPFILAPGWKIQKVLYGNIPGRKDNWYEGHITQNNSTVFTIVREE